MGVVDAGHGDESKFKTYGNLEVSTVLSHHYNAQFNFGPILQIIVVLSSCFAFRQCGTTRKRTRPLE